MKYDVVIIGGGLGGLECGVLMAKSGKRVCVIEKNATTGGCLQTFVRKGIRFDTGFHYVGALAEGQPLHTIFDSLGLLELPWHQLDSNGFDEIILENESYHFANGFETFSDTILTEYEKNGNRLSQKNIEGVKKYVSLLKEIGETTFDRLKSNSVEQLATQSYFSQSAYNYLKTNIDDEKLVAILSGASLKMEQKETLPLYTFAQINSSFIQSAWRIRGGGDQISKKLVKEIEQLGGKVLTHSLVTQLIERNGKIVAAEIENSIWIEGDIFISDLHPALTMTLLPQENSIVKNIFRRRITHLENTFGIFTVNLALKPNQVPYKNHNLFLHSNIDSIWNKNRSQEPFDSRSLMVSFQVPNDESPFTQNIDILMPMYWEEVQKWENTQRNHRGEEYEEFKLKIAEKCIKRVTNHQPELAGAIEAIYTSTPLTYKDYIGTTDGSAYGIRKDYSKSMMTVLSSATPLPNLFFTGQNLNLHGILGVSMTSLLTTMGITQ
ncbi:MAG: NAD(P)-binding protein [Bacteroidales bacterium]|nr:NAD(P)-binding protein [Bacteroidales bacterium]